MGWKKKKAKKKEEPEEEEPEDSEIIDTDEPEEEELEDIEPPKFISREFRELKRKEKKKEVQKEEKKRYYTVDDFIGYPQAVFQKEVANLLLITVEQLEDIKHLLAELKED